jgi:hypothetical protein
VFCLRTAPIAAAEAAMVLFVISALSIAAVEMPATPRTHS